VNVRGLSHGVATSRRPEPLSRQSDPFKTLHVGMSRPFDDASGRFCIISLSSFGGIDHGRVSVDLPSLGGEGVQVPLRDGVFTLRGETGFEADRRGGCLQQAGLLPLPARHILGQGSGWGRGGGVVQGWRADTHRIQNGVTRAARHQQRHGRDETSAPWQVGQAA
jgi:hypothetical protein